MPHNQTDNHITPNQIVKSIVSSIPSLVITRVKLDGSGNYTSWAASVELWFIGQGFENHLLKKSINIGATDRPA